MSTPPSAYLATTIQTEADMLHGHLAALEARIVEIRRQVAEYGRPARPQGNVAHYAAQVEESIGRLESLCLTAGALGVDEDTIMVSLRRNLYGARDQ